MGRRQFLRSYSNPFAFAACALASVRAASGSKLSDFEAQFLDRLPRPISHAMHRSKRCVIMLQFLHQYRASDLDLEDACASIRARASVVVLRPDRFGPGALQVQPALTPAPAARVKRRASTSLIGSGSGSGLWMAAPFNLSRKTTLMNLRISAIISVATRRGPASADPWTESPWPLFSFATLFLLIGKPRQNINERLVSAVHQRVDQFAPCRSKPFISIPSFASSFLRTLSAQRSQSCKTRLFFESMKKPFSTIWASRSDPAVASQNHYRFLDVVHNFLILIRDEHSQGLAWQCSEILVNHTRNKGKSRHVRIDLHAGAEGLMSPALEVFLQDRAINYLEAVFLCNS